MPALKVVGCCGSERGLTTRPFAGDDLQVLCVLTFAYRIIQMACIIPFWIRLFLFRLHGRNFVGPDGSPSWCVDDLEPFDAIVSVVTFGNSSAIEIDQDSSGAAQEMVLSFSVYLLVSVLYSVLDVGLSMAIWSAASVGTPTQPRGRDKALRSLFWIKVIFMNCLVIVVLGTGLHFVAKGRRTNYGCGEMETGDAVELFENTPWYTMFCIVMFTYAFELLFWPCVMMNQIGRSILSETSRSRPYRFIVSKERRSENTAAFLGGCFKCLQCLSCNQLGGGKIRAQAHLKDAAIVFMDFFNIPEANFDFVLSDVWLAFKLLSRVHRERKYKMSEQTRTDRERNEDGQIVLTGNGNDDDIGTAGDIHDDNGIFAAEDRYHIHHVGQNLAPNESGSSEDEFGAGNIQRSMLRRTDGSDVHHIKQAARYSNYAFGAYEPYQDALLAAGKLDGGKSGTYNPNGDATNDDVSLFSYYRLIEFGFAQTALVYATFANDVLATPYVILVDEEEKTVVISIRGTASLEDMVTDLQWKAIKTDQIAEVCGSSDMKEAHAHRGMLTKSKWICNDLKRRKILSRLLPTGDVKNTNNPCHGFRLMLTGHSLGAGIAAILSAMLRTTYPNLKCYAYCPPGCSVSLNFALKCADYVTSIVVGNDVIPRTRASNFEMLRFEFLEILARVKVSKIQAWRDLRIPCKNRDLKSRNKKLLHSREEIPASEYNKELEKFRQHRKRIFNEIDPIESRLNIPGRIIHLKPVLDRSGKSLHKYVPYWESLLSLREIELSIEVMKEHSIESLVPILNKIASDWDNAEDGTLEDDDDRSVGSVGPAPFNEQYPNFSADDRWFILCSRPNGSVSLIPTLLSIAGVCCSSIGSNICSLFFRALVDDDTFFSSTSGVDISGLSMGLYTYGVEYYYVGDDDYLRQCSPNVPAELKSDHYFKTARGFAALGLIVGVPTMLVLTLAKLHADQPENVSSNSSGAFLCGFQSVNGFSIFTF